MALGAGWTGADQPTGSDINDSGLHLGKESNGNLLTPTNFQGYGGAWNPNATGKPPYSWLEFGGAWPRHLRQQNVSFCDGHVKNLTLGQLTAGCDVKYGHGGAAYDGDKY